ncbi:MAG: hypothetical protein AAGA93_22045 [Actinomycetota bacterium]
MDHHSKGRLRRRRGVVVALVAALLLGLAGATAAEAHSNHRQRADIQGQGGEGIAKRNGARLVRSDHAIEVRWKLRTPKPGSYSYPDADAVPPGAPPHPEVVPGHPEVFTLWAFVFDHPDNCTDPCDFDDIGDTPARGSIYQLDGTVADGRRIHMEGKVRLGQAPAVGLGMSNPTGAEVHVAMAPHGMVNDDQLGRQLNGAIGGPPEWFPAIFPAR